MIYVIDRPIQSYIDDERQRVIKLARKVSGGFLLFCIERSYTVEDIPDARKRFEESEPDADAEDLM